MRINQNDDKPSFGDTPLVLTVRGKQRPDRVALSLCIT